MVALLPPLHCRHGSLPVGCSAKGGTTNPHTRSNGSGVMREGGMARRAHKIHTTHEEPKGVHVTHRPMPQTHSSTDGG